MFTTLFCSKNNGKFFKTIFLKEKNIHKNKNIFSLYNIHGLTSLKKKDQSYGFMKKQYFSFQQKNRKIIQNQKMQIPLKVREGTKKFL